MGSHAFVLIRSPVGGCRKKSWTAGSQGLGLSLERSVLYVLFYLCKTNKGIHPF